MADLTGRAGRPEMEAPIDDYTPSDPRPEGEPDQRPAPATSTELRLGKDECSRVIDDHRRQPESVCHPVAEGEAGP